MQSRHRTSRPVLVQRLWSAVHGSSGQEGLPLSILPSGTGAGTDTRIKRTSTSGRYLLYSFELGDNLYICFSSTVRSVTCLSTRRSTPVPAAPPGRPSPIPTVARPPPLLAPGHCKSTVFPSGRLSTAVRPPPLALRRSQSRSFLGAAFQGQCGRLRWPRATASQRCFLMEPLYIFPERSNAPYSCPGCAFRPVAWPYKNVCKV